MNSRIIILLVAAAILIAVLVPAIVFIATILLFVTPALLIAHRLTCEVSNAQPLALRTLPLFRAPPAFPV
ncbi:MAG: hypothetical protein QOI58_3868 [Thermoanaerobaculia bacterium]|jgi:hypothetical protein|nr:hypothetical protein [Thermoanaerobaculia bacterium]